MCCWNLKNWPQCWSKSGCLSQVSQSVFLCKFHFHYFNIYLIASHSGFYLFVLLSFLSSSHISSLISAFSLTFSTFSWFLFIWAIIFFIFGVFFTTIHLYQRLFLAIHLPYYRVTILFCISCNHIFMIIAFLDAQCTCVNTITFSSF